MTTYFSQPKRKNFQLKSYKDKQMTGARLNAYLSHLKEKKQTFQRFRNQTQTRTESVSPDPLLTHQKLHSNLSKKKDERVTFWKNKPIGNNTVVIKDLSSYPYQLRQVSQTKLNIANNYTQEQVVQVDEDFESQLEIEKYFRMKKISIDQEKHVQKLIDTSQKNKQMYLTQYFSNSVVTDNQNDQGQEQIGHSFLDQVDLHYRKNIITKSREGGTRSQQRKRLNKDRSLLKILESPPNIRQNKTPNRIEQSKQQHLLPPKAGQKKIEASYENSNYRTQSPQKWLQVFSQPHIADSIEQTLQNNQFGLGTENHPIYSFEDLGLTKNQERIKDTKIKLNEIKKRIQLGKKKELMKNILHQGYWRYKNKHFNEDEKGLSLSNSIRQRLNSSQKDKKDGLFKSHERYSLPNITKFRKTSFKD